MLFFPTPGSLMFIFLSPGLVFTVRFLQDDAKMDEHTILTLRWQTFLPGNMEIMGKMPAFCLFSKKKIEILDTDVRQRSVESEKKSETRFGVK